MTGWRSGDSVYDRSADVVLGLLDAIGARWTRPQWGGDPRAARRKGLHVIGKEKGVKIPNVLEGLRAASWNEVQGGPSTTSTSPPLALTGRPAKSLCLRDRSGKGETRSSPSRGEGTPCFFLSS